ncbi:MAG: DUF3035 domain-containing protein [Magnetococcus sp. DMHC-8]
MKHTLCWLYATSTLCLAGCSSNISLPWESNLLDPARIATREPLEIPPDLNTLPSSGTAREQDRARKVLWTDPSMAQPGSGKAAGKSAGSAAGKTAAGSDLTIHLPTHSPENKDAPALSRTEQEKLPAWMEHSGKGSDDKARK